MANPSRIATNMETIMKSIGQLPSPQTDQQAHDLWPRLVATAHKELLKSGYSESQAGDPYTIGRFAGCAWPAQGISYSLGEHGETDITDGMRGLYIAISLHAIHPGHEAEAAWISWVRAFGEDIHARHGWDGMSDVHEVMRDLCGLNTSWLEGMWDGIGDWVN